MFIPVTVRRGPRHRSPLLIQAGYSSGKAREQAISSAGAARTVGGKIFCWLPRRTVCITATAGLTRGASYSARDSTGTEAGNSPCPAISDGAQNRSRLPQRVRAGQTVRRRNRRQPGLPGRVAVRPALEQTLLRQLLEPHLQGRPGASSAGVAAFSARGQPRVSPTGRRRKLLRRVHPRGRVHRRTGMPAAENMLVVTSSVVVLAFRRKLEGLSDAEVVKQYEAQTVPNAHTYAYCTVMPSVSHGAAANRK